MTADRLGWQAGWYGLVGAIFLFDLLTPLGYAVPILYIVPLVLILFAELPLNGYAAAMGLVLLTWIKCIGALHGGESLALFNRSVITLVLFMVAFGVAVHARAAARAEELKQTIAKADADYRGLVESLPQMVWTCRSDGYCDYLSAQWIAYTGKPETEQLGAGWLDQVYPDDRVTVIDAWSKAVASEEPYEIVFRIRRADGVYRRFLTRAAPLRDGRGRVVKWFGSNSDVEDHMQAMDALRDKQEEFARVIRHADVGLWDWRLGTEHVKLSREWKSQLGYRDDEISDTFEEWRSRTHPDDVAPTIALVERCLSGESPGGYEAEFRMRHKDGSWRRILARGTLFRDAEGCPVRLAGIHLDVTALKESEEALRASEERYRLAEAGTTDGLWDWNIRTGEDYLSPRWKALLGYRADELRNHIESFMERLHPDDEDRVRRAIEEHLTSRVPYEVELRLRHKSGTYRWFQSRGRAVWNERGEPVRMAGAITDIMARKEAERIAREAQEFRRRQELAERLIEEREAISRNLHDGVLQSLYAVKLGLEHSRRLFKAAPAQASHCLDRQIEDVGLAIAEMRRFVEGRDPDWAQEQDLRRGLEALLKIYRSNSTVDWQLSIPDEAEFKSRLSPEDTRHLLFAVREAMSNVVRHADAGHCRISVDRADDRLRVVIEDDGLGFHLRARRRSGRGIGNMEARARQIGATVQVTTAPGDGTRIAIELIRREAHVSI